MLFHDISYIFEAKQSHFFQVFFNPLIIGIEPEISSRKPESLTPEESAILGELDNAYLEQMRAGFAGLLGAGGLENAALNSASGLGGHRAGLAAV